MPATPIHRFATPGRPVALRRIAAVTLIAAACGGQPTGPGSAAERGDERLDPVLTAMLESRSFTGRIEETLEARLGRPVDARLADVGRLLFFDPVTSLTRDNSCSGCHGPNVGFNDSQSIAIGVGNNGVVGPGRAGPRNLRRAPSVVNAAFYPRLMWDARFESLSLDPFDGSAGFALPEPEGLSLSGLDHLLQAQAHTPVVSREEMAGFEFAGSHDLMRAEIAARIDAVAEYRTLFGAVFDDVAAGAPIDFEHVARAIAEFQLTLVRADAPVDAFARGDRAALTADQKRGGILFFGEAFCGECHIVRGYANEMFSDFDTHVLAVPQLVPARTNARFDGAGANEDFGAERHTGDPEDRYQFRTSPLRNALYQPSLMHNGAYLCVRDAIRHHLRVLEMLDGYSTLPLDPSLHGPMGPVEPMLERLHDLVRSPPRLTGEELDRITDFVANGLADPDAHPDRLRALIPASVPSGLPLHEFQVEAARPDCS